MKSESTDKNMNSISKKLHKRFKSLDSFGEGVGFTIQGDENFKTGIGAFIRIVITIVILIYA